MFPLYSRFTRAIALKCIIRDVDVPSVSLGFGDGELLDPIVHGKPTLSQRSYQNVDKGSMADGQTQTGITGFGNLIPMISPGDIPYYGPSTGGGY